MKNLTKLVLSFNHLSDIPTEISQLTHVRLARSFFIIFYKILFYEILFLQLQDFYACFVA